MSRYFISTLKTIDFYQSLGCKRLGELVREELQGTKQITGSIIAQEIRSLLLERLPIFVDHNLGPPKALRS